jgi:ribosomal protein S18 acetylase RimI-like enzyme
MITYATSADGIRPEQLEGGFFEGWPNPPSPSTHFRILLGSLEVVLALDEQRVVGFITAVGDGVSAAYIPHLEVLPEYRGQGIGADLVRRMLDRLRNTYMVDLSCDENVVAFYECFGMTRANAMILRNYDRQACEP